MKVEPGEEIPKQRLVELLQRLATQGISQGQVAARCGVPPQYLSDTKLGRRPLTELFARRLAEEFGFNYAWLLASDEPLEKPSLSWRPSPGHGWLPVLSEPIEGDPLSNTKWEGTWIEVGSTASAKAAHAERPYVLRWQRPDVEGRLHKGDLVLVSQAASQTAELHVLSMRKGCCLARLTNRKWIRAHDGELLRGEPVIVGHCVGIVWAALA
jgi:transcriptional regulator with XRE-family HTH domain